MEQAEPGWARETRGRLAGVCDCHSASLSLCVFATILGHGPEVNCHINYNLKYN